MKTSVSKPEMNTLQSFFTNDRIMLALVFVNTLFIFVGGYFTSSRWSSAGKRRIWWHASPAPAMPSSISSAVSWACHW